MIRALALAVLALATSGCAMLIPVGRDFTRPTPTTFRLGETTADEVRRVLGEPRDQQSWSRSDSVLRDPPVVLPTPFGAASVNGTMRELYYDYIWRMGEAATGGVEPSRALRVWFWNDKLVGYRGSSSFKADSTGFDEAKVSGLAPWKSLRSDVVAALGQPSGVVGYPLTRGEDQQLLIYHGFEWDTSRKEQRTKVLYVLVNLLGIVEELRYDGSSRPLPPPAVTPGVSVPVYIPPPPRRNR